MRSRKLWQWFVVAALLCSFAALAVAQEVAQDEDAGDEAAGTPRKRAEWFYDQRAYPAPKIPAGSHARAVKQAERLFEQQSASIAASASSTAPSTSTWMPIGPQPLNSPFWGGNSGRITSIAVDPTNNNIVYAAAADGGLWKTLNGGQSWTPISDSLPTLATGAVALAPSSPNIIYLGTGETNFATDNYTGNGIYKSLDSGVTWTRAGTQFSNSSVAVLAVDPANPNLVLAGVYYGGLYRSIDGGGTWSNVLAGSRAVATSVWFDPNNGNSVYAAMGYPWGDASNGVYHSADAGTTWTKINGTGVTALPSDLGRIALSGAPSNPNVLYAGIQAASSLGFLGVYKSLDAGASWTKLNTAPAYCGNQCWYDNAVTVDATNPNVAYFGGAGNSDVIVTTTDGGATWSDLTRGSNGVRVHSDVHALAIAGNKLYAGTDGGAWSTTDLASATPAWTNLNSTLNITQFYPGMSIRQDSTSFTLAGTQDNGTLIYNGVMQWTQVACGDGMHTAIDPQTPATMYATCQGAATIQRSLNGGSNWTAITNGINTADRAAWVLPIAIDPAQPANIYFGTYRLYQSRNAGNNWTPVSGDLTGGCTSPSRCTISTIAVAPSDSNTLYVGTLDGHLQVTSNALSSPSFTDKRNGLPGRAVTHIVVSPTSPVVAWATFSGFNATAPAGHVFATTDGGNTWQSISGNLPDSPANDFEIDPDCPNTYYVATDVGVFRTVDGGVTWAPLGNGLPLSTVQSIRLFRSQRVLRAATHGRGMWDIALGAPSFTIAPTTLTFPTTQVGLRSTVQNVSIANNTGAAVTISSILASTNFSLANNCGAVLADGASCTIQVTFAPVSVGSISGTLTINDSAPASPHVVTLNGTATGLPAASLAPTSLTFPKTNAGDISAAQNVILTNSGAGPLNIYSYGTGLDFRVTSSTCSYTLDAGSSCTITVAFAPTTGGNRTGQLSVSDNAAGSPHNVALSGTATAIASAHLTQSGLTFHYQRTGTRSDMQTATLSATGGPLTITSIMTTGDFSTTTNCPTSPAKLAAGSSCGISVAFAPTADGPRTGAVTITDDSGGTVGTKQTLALGGTGYTPQATLSPSSLNFPDALQNSTSPAKIITLASSGNGPLTISKVVTSTNFSATNDCGTVIAAGTSCSIRVSFTPSVLGVTNGTLTLTSDAPTSTQTLALSGTAADLQISRNSSAAQPTIAPGGTTSWPITVTSNGGFSGDVTLTCSGAPPGASCAISPANGRVNDSTPLNANVTLATTPRGNAIPATRGVGGVLSFVFLAFAGVCTLCNRRALSLLRATMIVTLLATLMFMASCGGGGNSGASTSAAAAGTPAGTYTLTITATSAGGSRSLPITVQIN